MLTNAVPSAQTRDARRRRAPAPRLPTALPDDPGQEMVPVAEPEPTPATGTPVEWEAKHQEWAGNILTLTGNVVVHYRDYVIRADKVVYNRTTTELEADGHLQVTGGPNDVLINATHGDMRLNMHTARFYNVNGSQGVRTDGTHGRVFDAEPAAVLGPRAAARRAKANTGLIDGSITNCRLPHPDWRIIAHAIAWTTTMHRRRTRSSSFLGFRSSTCPICTIRPTRRDG